MSEDFLVSQYLYNRIDHLLCIEASFAEEMTPGGKQATIRVYGPRDKQVHTTPSG
ncbi:MAG: hypothetical protein OEM26_08800 [Saprospiraceae bacterium]|nr:hypothetical protein [Saprospiraceae bacterium]